MCDGARRHLFTGARRSRDQRGEIAHARVQRAAVAAHVVREDRLPDGGAQPRRGHGAADDVAKDLLEGALDLAEAGEGVDRIVTGGQAADLEEASSRAETRDRNASGPDARRCCRSSPRRTADSSGYREDAGRRLRTAPDRLGRGVFDATRCCSPSIIDSSRAAMR